jgi:sugar phosphate isomerase/epimerase
MIAVQLYTVRDQLQAPAQLGGVLRRLRDIGYQAVEVAGLGPAAHARFGAELARAEMVACAVHTSLQRLVSDLEGVAAECREWGCQYVVLPSLPDEYRSESGYRRFASEAVELAERLRAFALQLVYHNHSHELERYGKQTGLDVLFAASATGTLKAELDTYWLQYGGVNPSAFIRGLKGRVPLVHLKDMAVRDGRPMQVEVGEGNLDWPDILNACRYAETEWLVVEQDESERDPMESLAISYSNLVNLVAEMKP